MIERHFQVCSSSARAEARKLADNACCSKFMQRVVCSVAYSECRRVETRSGTRACAEGVKQLWHLRIVET